MNRILFVANVAKEHILKFHVPSIKKFKDEGWQVDVACYGDEEIPYCDHQFHCSWRRSPFTIKTFVGIHELKKIINENNYDVIYCHTPVGGFVSRIACQLSYRNPKVVYFAHGFHFFKHAPIINWLVYYPIEKLLAKFTDTIITINKEDYENAKARLKCNDVHLINGMGINLIRFLEVNKPVISNQYRKEMNIPPHANVLVYVAELIPNKNQTMLLKALYEVLKVHENTYLVLVGCDHNHGFHEKMANELGIRAYVRFLGWRSDIENIYASSDICVASSIREGFGLNIVEALASGLPVIATKNRGHETIIEHGENGYLVEIDDAQDMAKKICECIENKQRITISEESLLKYDENEIIKTIYQILTK